MIFNFPSRFITITFQFLLTLFLSMSILSCNDTDKPKSQVKKTDKVVIKQAFKEKVTAQTSDEFLFLDTNCLYCHKMTDKTQGEKIAPTMKEVINYYKKSFSTKENFVNAIVKFGTNPTKDNFLMKQAVKEYGLMPNSGITKEDIEEISVYLYDYKF